MPTLSIITINLNNTSGLKRTMESVINQTSTDFEYIIIDGGSSDDSVNVIKSFTDIAPGIYSSPQNQPITYWISEPDTGIYNAMNKGIKIAKGEYCQFLNSGDWLVSANVTEHMLSNLPPCNIIYGNMIKQRTDGRLIYNKQINTNSALAFHKGTMNHSSSYIKRALFEKYGLYDETLEIVSDWKFFLVAIALNNESVAYKDIDVVWFDMNGISNNREELLKKERRCVLEKLIPINILADYDRYTTSFLLIERINRYKFTKGLMWFIDRLLFKWEKHQTRKTKHIIQQHEE